MQLSGWRKFFGQRASPPPGGVGDSADSVKVVVVFLRGIFVGAAPPALWWLVDLGWEEAMALAFLGPSVRDCGRVLCPEECAGDELDKGLQAAWQLVAWGSEVTFPVVPGERVR
jgi:hypothetical protein